MTTHISARLAWHDTGWNGHICREPKSNTYCVGQYSYQRDLLSTRNLEWEEAKKGKPCNKIDGIPPCIHSINAFGDNTLEAYGPPPEWFRDNTEIKKWDLKPFTVSVWPYEEMYKDEVLNQKGTKPKYNPIFRRDAAKDFFKPIDENKSLIFYYANFSNPFSEEDKLQYVIVGVSRIKKVGPEHLWIGQSDEMREKYGANAWFRDITSHYPNEGLRIPYHKYMDQPEILEKILLVPENPRDFKYATRHVADDGALTIIERLMEIVGYLQSIGDKTEDWNAHLKWLGKVLAELWKNRGIYPGLASVMDYIGFPEGVKYCIERTNSGDAIEDIHEVLFQILETGNSIEELKGKSLKDAQRRWRYLQEIQQKLIKDTLPRFDIKAEQIQKIVDRPLSASIWSSRDKIIDNPYILSEEYIGETTDDVISFSKIDHGMIPSPDVGEALISADDPTRLRALIVDQLIRQSQHTFQRAQKALDAINRRLDYLPEWKHAVFTLRHLEVEKEVLEPTIVYRELQDTLFLYLGVFFVDERLVEKTIRELTIRPDITLQFPVTESTWKNLLTDVESTLSKYHPEDYELAINSQVSACQSIFQKPVSVLAGEAGTGKTTLVKAVIAAIEKAHGAGTSFQLLAPTGKAADRLRDRTGKYARTIHSFIAEHGWLNDNFTFKRRGGERVEGFSTIIIDESSMLDLALIACLFRSVNWNSIQRIIFVGDPNQLPPIGTGKVFADLIDWMKDETPNNLAELSINMRQIENKLSGKGTGILDLASLYTRKKLLDEKSADDDIKEDEIFEKLLEGGDVTGDLRALYWNTPEALEQLLLKTVIEDMESDTGIKQNEERAWELWNAYFYPDKVNKPERSQVLSPYRGELAGTEHLNQFLQNKRSQNLIEQKGTLGAITFFDKVIQIRNRTGREQLWSYNRNTKKSERIDLFNGEIGTVKVHGFDANKNWMGNPYFHISRFQVTYSRKEHLWVNYESDSQVEGNLELAYVVSVHKSQGSEFERVYLIVPKHRKSLMWRELFYTGLTRAQNHCTLLIEEDISPLERLRRREMSQISRINSSLFIFRPVPEEMEEFDSWYEEGKIHKALTGDMVRSKSEVIIANLLDDRNVPFTYEISLRASDGTVKRPDFTIKWAGETWYWEHEGMLHDPAYRKKQEAKHEWYEKHGFSGNLIISKEGPGFDSQSALEIIDRYFPR
jgi:exodeoxyribonuclease V alpha subunit